MPCAHIPGIICSSCNQLPGLTAGLPQMPMQTITIVTLEEFKVLEKKVKELEEEINQLKEEINAATNNDDIDQRSVLGSACNTNDCT